MDAGNKISKLLAFLGSQYGLLSQPLWMESVSFIFGKVRKKHVQDYDVILFQNEVVRSPNFVHANPALVFQKVVYLRQEAFDAMYHQKWKPVLNPDSFVTSNIQNQPFWNISFAIKETVLSLYGIKDEASLQGSQAQFTKEMQDTILHHEWGHSVVNDRIFPYENIAIAEGMEHHPKEEIFDAFLEFMADFAPDNEGLCGPFKRMVDIAKTDTIKATRMFYMYLSDVFFYDTMDYFMFTYSDLMCLAMLRYIKPDKSIDFHLLEHDLHFNESKTGTFFEKVYKLYWEYSDGIMQIAKNATFALPSGDKNYAYVKGLCVKEAQVSNSFIKASDKLFLSIFWINIYAYLDKFAPNDYKKLLNFIEKIKKELVMKIMILSCGRKKAESYHYDHRKYIQEQFFALGFTSRFSK